MPVVFNTVIEEWFVSDFLSGVPSRNGLCYSSNDNRKLQSLS